MFNGDPNDPNGGVQKALLFGCLLVVSAIIGLVVLVVRLLS
jgi:hypothetical protein